jgi:hypothetical protein
MWNPIEKKSITRGGTAQANDFAGNPSAVAQSRDLDRQLMCLFGSLGGIAAWQLFRAGTCAL